jgi:tetratricopeptide (TPR) repeat protein
MHEVRTWSVAELVTHIDSLTALCLAGRRRTAMALAEAQPNALARALGLAAVFAALNQPDAMAAAVRNAATLAPGHTLVLQAEGMLAALRGDGADAVAKARASVDVSTSDATGVRAQVGLARMLLLHGQVDSAARREGLALLGNLVRYGKDTDAFMTYAGVLQQEGGSPTFEDAARVFVANPRDPRAMQWVLGSFREQAWALGVATLADHVRYTTTSLELRYMAGLLRLASSLYMGRTPWAALLPVTDTVRDEVWQDSLPMPPLARLTLANLLIDLGRFEDAQRLCDEVRDRMGNPEGFAQHHYLEGRLAQTRGDHATAFHHYAEAFDIWPEHLDAACNALDLALAANDANGLAKTAHMLARIPETLRRTHVQLSYNEARWHEAEGRRAAALVVVDALAEAPLGHMGGPVMALRERLGGA